MSHLLNYAPMLTFSQYLQELQLGGMFFLAQLFQITFCALITYLRFDTSHLYSEIDSVSLLPVVYEYSSSLSHKCPALFVTQVLILINWCINISFVGYRLK